MSDTAASGFIGGPDRDGRWICTEMRPYDGKTKMSAHPAAVELSWYDDGEDCIGRYRCPICGKEFRAVIPR
jgi:hypothetical protein